jgi:hypothetical protein
MFMFLYYGVSFINQLVRPVLYLRNVYASHKIIPCSNDPIDGIAGRIKKKKGGISGKNREGEEKKKKE